MNLESKNNVTKSSLKLSPQKKATYLFLGDSLTEGYLVDAENSYPRLVEKKLKGKGYSVKIINAGLSGDTTAGGLNRYKWFLKTNFDVIFIALGSNDGLRGLSLRVVEKNLIEIIKQTKKKSPSIKIILAGLNIPSNYGQEYSQKFKKLFKIISQKEKILYYPFLLQGVAGEIELNHNDGIHPNEQGYKKIANRLTKFLINNLYEKK